MVLCLLCGATSYASRKIPGSSSSLARELNVNPVLVQQELRFAMKRSKPSEMQSGSVNDVAGVLSCALTLGSPRLAITSHEVLARLPQLSNPPESHFNSTPVHHCALRCKIEEARARVSYPRNDSNLTAKGNLSWNFYHGHGLLLGCLCQKISHC